MNWPTKKYKTVVIDPPWPASGYLDRARGNGRNGPLRHTNFDYGLMSIEEIQALPIGSILSSDAFVFLWTINGFLKSALSIVEGWNLSYMTTMTWVKPHGPKPVGYPVYNTEFIIVAKRGRPKFLTTKDFRTANFWEAPRNMNAAPGAWGRQIANCTKPEGFYQMLRRVTPGPRIDLFSRRRIGGFDAWGNECPEKFEEKTLFVGNLFPELPA